MREEKTHPGLATALMLALVCLNGCGGGSSSGAPESGTFTATLVAEGMDVPTTMEFAPDGRLFVLQQSGAVRVIKNGALLPTPFATLPVNSEAGTERGLLGITFDPDFGSNQSVYFYYTAASPVVHNRIVRLTAAGDTAVPGSETVLFDLDPITKRYHNGGAIHFGKDRKLYAGVGDDQTPANAQRLDNLFGKLLRINADGSIPTDNPFYTAASGNNRAIWALGLRNPFNFAVQPGSGQIFINDVGEDTWETIWAGQAGRNYGWPEPQGDPDDHRGRTPPPVAVYTHGSGDDRGCAIVGAAFYNPKTVVYPRSYIGQYFFADYCNGWVRRMDPASGATTLVINGLKGLVDVKVGPDGLAYCLTYSGAVYSLKYTAS